MKYNLKNNFPSTRYQGSKLKLSGWIWNSIRELDFFSCLDAFGGTGSIAYRLKAEGKSVAYNDILKFNHYIGLALIENSNTTLSTEEINFLIKKHRYINYPSFIYNNFKDIYFTDEENEWLDIVVTNINFLDNIYKKAIAYFALFQSCIIKRPFNLFHRKNLYVRLSDVKRSFGNKVTWDTPFEVHFRKFVNEANNAVFSNGEENRALNMDVFHVEGKFDLVYIDTPYISEKGVSVNYLDFYHFLEGMVNYGHWKDMINHNSKHKKLKLNDSIWTDKYLISSAFDRLFDKFRESILVVSYRSDGIPSSEELIKLLKKYKSHVTVIKSENYKYVLSKNMSDEMLLIAI